MKGLKFRKYSILECVVEGYSAYGLELVLESGERGYASFQDTDHGDGRTEELPPIGTVVRSVLLSIRRDGRFVVSTRKRDLDLIDSIEDPESCLKEWSRIMRCTRIGKKEALEFLALDGARPVLRWALSHPGESATRRRALDIFAFSSGDL